MEQPVPENQNFVVNLKMTKTDTVQIDKFNSLTAFLIQGIFESDLTKRFKAKEDLWYWIQEQIIEGQIGVLEDVYVRDYPTKTSIKLIEKLTTLKNEIN